MTTSAPTHEPLTVGTLLDRIADEIGGLARVAREIPAPVGLADDAAIVAAQKQDLLEQTLDDLSAFLRMSAAGVCGSAKADVGPALKGLRLSALAARLSGARAPAVEAAGDLDLF